MVDASSVRAIVARHFDRLKDVGKHLVRAERTHDDRPFLVAYFDLGDEVVARASTLSQFQEDLLGPTFFDTDGGLRWNSYLYFWAGPRSKDNPRFAESKSQIERNRQYARKFVVSETELDSRLARIAVTATEATAGEDASKTWSDLLRAASLGAILDQPPRTQAIDAIASGRAFAAERLTRSALGGERPDPLAHGKLRTLKINSFRPILDGREFTLRDVTLVFGPNGSGKTSLLEAVEALYCGRVRRDRESSVGGIEAVVTLDGGFTEQVVSTTNAATLKARNLNWYGRSDPQSHALLQGFSRFNFLDTDAAFRLSAGTNSDEIMSDLSRLLVGPEAAKLFTYLSKLQEDLLGKQQSLRTTRILAEAQVRTLTEDLARLRAMPSESQTLARSYFARIESLGAKWRGTGHESSLDRRDRDRLQLVLRCIGQALSVAGTTPVTKRVLRERLGTLEQLGLEIQAQVAIYADASEELARCDEEAQRVGGDAKKLERWLRYCGAGAPALAARLSTVNAEAVTIRSRLRELATEHVAELPAEYELEPLIRAIQLQAQRLRDAEQQQQIVARHLQESEHVGQTLATLRRDLVEVARAIIDRTGDSSHCPVCRTEHTTDQLTKKLASLEAAESASATEGLRGAARSAVERVEAERQIQFGLRVLDAYRRYSGGSETLTTREALDGLHSDQARLRERSLEHEQLRSAVASIERLGVTWSEYDSAMTAATTLIPAADAADESAVRGTLGLLRGRMEELQRQAERLRRTLAGSSQQSLAKARNAVGVITAGATPAEILTAVDRTSGQVRGAITAIEQATSEMAIAEGQSLEDLQTALSEALRELDRALHAQQQESASQLELRTKSDALETAGRDVLECTRLLTNCAKALDVLTRIVKDHSLDRATRKTLDAIRQRVTDIFARIHAPSEYSLASLHGDALLRTLDSNQPRRVSQVSTGQRGALALSVFLSLNASAGSAPPIVLIDDPIAHIDDLNALSFLDYLRDLVLGTDRQVLFATADGRVAGLFERKFEFLGERRFRKIVLSR